MGTVPSSLPHTEGDASFISLPRVSPSAMELIYKCLWIIITTSNLSRVLDWSMFLQDEDAKVCGWIIGW
ncbi:unnamed protein product [Urochloa humidicola]